MQVRFANTLGKKIALVAAVLSIACLIVYVPYESNMKALDIAVVGMLIAVVACDVAYASICLKARFDVMGIVQIAGAAAAAFAFTNYLNDDIANLADLLNGVTIFSGGSGDVNTIFLIIGLLVVIGIIQIVTCFMKPEE